MVDGLMFDTADRIATQLLGPDEISSITLRRRRYGMIIHITHRVGRDAAHINIMHTFHAPLSTTLSVLVCERLPGTFESI